MNFLYQNLELQKHNLIMEWNVNYLGLISNYKLTLVDKDVKNDYYKIKLLRIGPISSHETVLKEISLTKEGIKSIKLNAPGIGSDIECVFFKKEI